MQREKKKNRPTVAEIKEQNQRRTEQNRISFEATRREVYRFQDLANLIEQQRQQWIQRQQRIPPAA